MSETEQDQAPAEPDAPLGDPVESPGGPQDEPIEQPDVTPETPATPPAENEADIEAIYARLETRAKNYVKSVSEIIDGAGVPIALCEMCGDCYPGMRWIEPSDEIHAQLIALAGAQNEESLFNDDPNALMCDDCKGYGRVRLPTHVFNNKSRKCRRCNGAGYLERNPQSGTPQSPDESPRNGSLEVPEGIPEDDPAIVSLMERGYMVTKLPDFSGAAEA